jgi:hypothetical protein
MLPQEVLASVALFAYFLSRYPLIGLARALRMTDLSHMNAPNDKLASHVFSPQSPLRSDMPARLGYAKAAHLARRQCPLSALKGDNAGLLL